MMTPRRTDTILIACSRLRFEASHRDAVLSACGRGDVDWERTYSAAVAHKVAPLVYRNLLECGPLEGLIPAKILDDFRETARATALRNSIARRRIAEMASFFAGRSHELLLLKHAAFAVLAPNLFASTMSDDIDAVVRPADEPPGAAEDRYRCRLRPWSFSGRLQKAFRRWTYEDTDATSALLHKFANRESPWGRFVGIEVDNRVHHDVAWNGIVAIDFRAVWDDADRRLVDGTSVRVPRVADVIIMNAINIHRKPFIRLRNLVELHELIPSLKGRDWEELAERSLACGCGAMVYSALHATRAVLGGDLPDHILDSLRAGPIRRRAIAYLNRRMTPVAHVAPGRDPSDPRRTLGDVARRFLSLDAAQWARLLWLRIVLHRILGVVQF